MIPLGDDNSGRRRSPLVTYAFIALNVVVFVFFQQLGANERFTYAFSAVPLEITTGRDIAAVPLQPTPIPVWLTLLTSMFMHGGIAHLLGNMLYLWIFGDNIEDELGRGRYAVFYLVCGVAAGLAHVAATTLLGQNPLLPALGASGAIAGVLGAYLVLHPHRRVRMLIGRAITQVPAIVAIGLWFVFQLVAGLGMLGAGSQAGGVAYGAHIGGFVAGVALIKLFAPARSRRS